MCTLAHKSTFNRVKMSVHSIYLHKIYLCIVGDILVYLVAEENWMLIGDIRNGRWTVAVDMLLPMDEVGALKYNFTAQNLLLYLFMHVLV